MKKVLFSMLFSLLLLAGSANALPPQCLDDGQPWQAALVEGKQVRGENLFKISQSWTSIRVNGLSCGIGSSQRIKSLCISSESGRWYYVTNTSPAIVNFNSPVGIPIQVTASGHCVKNANSVKLPLTLR